MHDISLFVQLFVCFSFIFLCLFLPFISFLQCTTCNIILCDYHDYVLVFSICDNSTGSPQCACKAGYTLPASGPASSCHQRVLGVDKCNSTTECSTDIPNSVCTNNTCQCPSSYQPTDGNTACSLSKLCIIIRKKRLILCLSRFLVCVCPC